MRINGLRAWHFAWIFIVQATCVRVAYADSAKLVKACKDGPRTHGPSKETRCASREINPGIQTQKCRRTHTLLSCLTCGTRNARRIPTLISMVVSVFARCETNSRQVDAGGVSSAHSSTVQSPEREESQTDAARYRLPKTQLQCDQQSTG